MHVACHLHRANRQTSGESASLPRDEGTESAEVATSDIEHVFIHGKVFILR